MPGVVEFGLTLRGWRVVFQPQLDALAEQIESQLDAKRGRVR